jgi:hypothetical protein
MGMKSLRVPAVRDRQPVALIERCRLVVLGIDDEGVGGDRVAQGAADGIRGAKVGALEASCREDSDRLCQETTYGCPDP